MNAPADLLVVIPPNIAVAMTGAWRATQDAKDRVVLHYTDGTTDSAVIHHRIDDMGWFALVDAVQAQRAEVLA